MERTHNKYTRDNTFTAHGSLVSLSPIRVLVSFSYLLTNKEVKLKCAESQQPVHHLLLWQRRMPLRLLDQYV